MSEPEVKPEQPSKILRLLRGDLTYSAAKRRETNILHELTYCEQERKFLLYLYRNRHTIRSTVAQHLGSTAKNCHVTDPVDWLCGTFNVCIRVDVRHDTQPEKQVLIRFPLPYRIGEQILPGNSDEKIRCETGTYAWLQANCPDIPIPLLHGFALGTGQTFTHIENLPFPSQGKMLSKTWEEGRHDAHLRKNLFHGLSRALVQLAQIPIPRIGSFILDDQGYLRLANRPLSLEIHQSENEGLPIDIPRQITYESTDSYIHNIFSLHESRLRHQPNAVGHLEDGAYQTSALMVMRSVWSCFFRREFLRGPFVLSLTDIHQSNIFVDDEWNITYFIDLEWACSRPIEMIHPPFWLSNQAVDMITIPEYEPLHAEFMQALAEEETTPPVLYSIMQQGWESGTFWCSLALDSPTGLFQIFYDHIKSRFAKESDESDETDGAFWLVTMPYWGFGTFQFLEGKMEDKEKYDIALHEAFTS
ncbi:hypothetical protein N7456_002938 [Penicillium angulare]|uniref:Aminoglycoside phosphotransferase domain-containing protein n=1 Tax=Penicillium angulare TaxID=116970 RepID=A0A9W9FTU1_9EURO|nr:hypothetical protein N7456_002938 [Penicillium angulare]